MTKPTNKHPWRSWDYANKSRKLPKRPTPNPPPPGAEKRRSS